MSRKKDHEYKLLFRERRKEPTITITSTPSHLLCINHSTKGKVHYDVDVTNIDGAAAYISGVYHDESVSGGNLSSSLVVELVHENTNKVIASWDYSSLRRSDAQHRLSINVVKSILKSLQIREE